MALTAEGNALSDRHRRQQAAVSAYLLGQLGALWPKLDPNRLDETRGPWLESVVALVGQGYNTSAALAAAFLPAFRTVEGIAGAAPAVPLRPLNTAGVIAAQALLGPIGIKQRLAKGLSLDEAVRLAQAETAAAATMHAGNGGRSLVLDTVNADRKARGWARVASGSACAFCAMLCSRGPVYKHEGTARFHPHGGCNCHVEPVYSDSPDAWPPIARHFEDEWVAASTDAELDAVKTSDTRAADRRTRGGDRDRRAAMAAYRKGNGPKPPPLETLDRQMTQRERDALNAYRRHLYSQRTTGAANAGRADALEAHAARLNAKAPGSRKADVATKAAARARANTPAARAAAVAQADAEAQAAGELASRMLAEQRTRETAAAATPPPTPTVPSGTVGELTEAQAVEAAAVHLEERARAEAYTEALNGAQADDAGVPWHLSYRYLSELDEDELDGLTDHLVGRLDDDNPLEGARWSDLELYLDHKTQADAILEQAGHVDDDTITRELAELDRTHGRAGLTHDAGEQAAAEAHLDSKAARPSRAEVQRDYAVFLEELYIRAEDATRGVWLNAKGRGKGISGRSLLSGDVRRLLRYGSEELLEFFEDPANRRVQWSEFYAERTGSEAFASAAARQRRISQRIDRDRNVIDLVTNREA